MDGRLPAGRLARLGLVGCLAVLCWIALRSWTPSEGPLIHGNRESRLSTEERLLPPGRPLIDWSLFRFPSLDVSPEGIEPDLPTRAGNLLELLQPRHLARDSELGPTYDLGPELEWTPPRLLNHHSLADIERATALARGIDAWFPDNGLYHPWFVLGMNTSRAWHELGYWWSCVVPNNPGAAAVRSALAGHERVKQFVTRRQPKTTVQLVGPRLIVEPGDRLAMASRPLPAHEPTDGKDPFTIAEPTALFTQLERLAEHTESALWACEVDQHVRHLCTGSLRDAGNITNTLARLDRLRKQAREMAGDCRDESLRTELLQAHYGLSRRINRWQLAADLHHRRATLWTMRLTRQRLERLLQDNELVDDPSLTTSLPAALASGRPLNDDLRRELSRELLARTRLALQDSNLGASLSGALDHDWQALLPDSMDVPELLAELEVLELEGSPRVAQDVAAGRRQLAASVDERHRQLAHEIEESYRNANFRLAVSGELLNRWLPEQPHVSERVHERIAGSPVRGQARMQTELFVRLVPDPFVWRVGLEATGEVASRTYSGEGSVNVRTEGATRFEARKLLLVRADGPQLWPAVATAETSQRLLGVSSSYDSIPVMGSYVRSQAQEEYNRRREIARREVEAKAAARARTTLDQRTHEWIRDIERRVRASALSRADALGLEVTPVELRTTDTRLIARLRLASENQLSAYTPRPQAPADSALSVQLHDSALTNALQGLALDGRRLTAAELVDLLQDKLGYIAERVSDGDGRTEFAFADRPVQVRFQEGRVHLTLAIDEMKHDRSLVQDFKVHAIYHPEVEGLSARLVRDGVLQMEGRLRHTDRARLHAVFGKVLAEDRALELVRFPNNDDATQRLAGLVVTQLVIDDGWLGLSIGPEASDRTAVTERTVK